MTDIQASGIQVSQRGNALRELRKETVGIGSWVFRVVRSEIIEDSVQRDGQGKQFMCRCDGPDVAHVPRQRSACDGGRIYFLFKACEDGCLPCVRELVEKEGVDPKQLSLSGKYTAMDFAEWGQSCSSSPDKYDDVIAYLNVCATSLFSQDCSHVSLSAVSPVHCSGPDVAHVPPDRCGKAAERIYYLYKAAEHGCLPCVKQLIESEGLDPRKTSLTCHYSAADFARWGQSRSSRPARYEEVLAYLDDVAPVDAQWSVV